MATRKFDLKAVYTKTNFIAILTEIKESCTAEEEVLLDYCQKYITWAQDHPNETIFEWKTHPDGVIKPVATYYTPPMPIGNLN